MQAIYDAADNSPDEKTLTLQITQLSDVANFAADNILEWMDGKAQEQWNGEYALAHL